MAVDRLICGPCGLSVTILPVHYLASQEITQVIQLFGLLTGVQVVGILLKDIFDLALVALLVEHRPVVSLVSVVLSI